jgi:hypothetical protein
MPTPAVRSVPAPPPAPFASLIVADFPARFARRTAILFFVIDRRLL